MVGVAVNEAVEVKQRGNLEEALRFLSIGGDVIERFTPSLLCLLAIMTHFSRMAAAITPVKPLVPEHFQLSEVANLAQLHRLLHQFVVSTGQRFRLKLHIIGKALSITSRYLLRHIEDVILRRSPEEKDWQQVVSISQDFQRLSDESLQSFRVLLDSLSNDDARRLAQSLFLPGGSMKQSEDALLPGGPTHLQSWAPIRKQLPQS
ncbi:MAG: hypothetical protein AB1898_06020 [Acidobacteriota bacterium]